MTRLCSLDNDNARVVTIDHNQSEILQYHAMLG